MRALVARIAASPRASLALVAAVALCGAALVSARYPPLPQAHDEFSYLLAADTFAHGRLANPPHPLWVHFESPHILQQPTYGSKYPPLQGLVLAFGQCLGAPIAGVWLAFALACAASCWMLRGWLGAGAGLAGGLLLALHPQLVAVWGAWLWGGAAPMAGGALVFGAAPRLLRLPRARDGLLLGAGAGALALSRPFEGLVACLPVGALLLHGLWREPARRARLLRALAPGALALAAAGALMGLHNWRVTGSAALLPYAVYNRSYAAVPDFLFLDPPPARRYRHEVMRAFHEGEYQAGSYRARRSLAGFATGAREKLALYWRFFFLHALSLALLGLIAARREPGVRFAALAGGIFAAGLLVETYEQRHYAAPIAPLLGLLWVAALGRVASLRAGGRRIGPALVALLLAAAFAEHLAAARDLLERRARGPLVARAQLLRDLEALGGRHLVVVRYGPRHNVHSEWVYNRADIDAARVVFAREMDPPHDRALLRHFADRRAWLLTPDDLGVPLRAYPAGRRPLR